MPEQYLAQTQQQRLQILAPQLPVAALLQVPILELRTLVQQEMQQNPTLEEKLLETTQVEVEPGSSEPEDNKELDFKEEFEVLARLDDEWREYFQQSQSSHQYTAEDAAKRQYFFDSITQPESLQEHLLAQLPLAGLPVEDKLAGELIIGSINDDGYLTATIEELAHSTGSDAGRLQRVLKVIQEFDHRRRVAHLRECLLLQLKRLGRRIRWLPRGLRLPEAPRTTPSADRQGAQDHPRGAPGRRRLHRDLEPKPAACSPPRPSYVPPEVQVQKVGETTSSSSTATRSPPAHR